MRLYEFFQDEKAFYLVLEYCMGGNLLEGLSKIKTWDEYKVGSIVKQIVAALRYCHSFGIVHRDVKLENAAFESGLVDSPVKLLDFGASLRIGKRESIKDLAGSVKI